MANADLTSAFRAVRPNEVADRGETWTPTTRADDPNDRHDRIDFVLTGGSGVRVLAAEIVGEDDRSADVVVPAYPSDHRAVVATFELSHAPG